MSNLIDILLNLVKARRTESMKVIYTEVIVFSCHVHTNVVVDAKLSHL